ncbi:hypothetical protein [Paenibacillus montanisoli]|uniref:Sporulation protein n=1 Tax=Paenibacillus montanisoli TaxID=2081970 RepID=A0A328TSL6_9BACL|nr:hypothetical protein [Paenibacillus montanisoli]RAP73488.1 hypothetical protein DL346_27740 [Paenibacillus montanisoli]
MRVKSALLGAIALMTAISLSACGGNKDATNNYNSNSYGHDGYMGLSNSNPNLPNRNGQFLNYDDDGDFAQRQLAKVSGVDKANITIQGPDMNVSITPKRGVNREQLRARALKVLRDNMPRYHVSVRVK